MARYHEISRSVPVEQHHPTLPIASRSVEDELAESVLLEASSGDSIDQRSLNFPNTASDEKHSLEPTITTSELTSDIDTEARRCSSASTTCPPPGIYRRTPMVMLFGLLVGFCCFTVLHVWYTCLSGTFVGNALEQQLALGLGNALAICASAGFNFSIQKSYEQWIWRELKSHTVSFEGIDKACSTSKDPLSFFNKEIWRKTTLSNMLALLCFLIPIAAFFAPATLSVRTEMRETIRSMHVPRLDIAQAVQYASYAYAVTGTLLSLEKFLGPRTIIMRWAVATASAGEMPNLPVPAPNGTYGATFWAPYVKCDSSTSWVTLQTDGMIDRFQEAQAPSVELVSLDYFVAVPALSDFTNGTEAVQVANLTDPDDAAYASNQLWIYFSRYKASLNFSEPIEKHYLTCQLYNASYTTRFTWVNGRQDLQVLNRTKLHPVAYPANASILPESEVSMAYSAVMWALSTQLTGSIAFYKDLNATEDVTQETHASRIYSEIATNIAATVLVGTSDLNSHFAENHLLGNGSSLYSDQHLQDMGLRRRQAT
jgi:hypothetical protein